MEKHKTKKERRAWWYGLTDAEKAEWIDKWQQRRELRRKKRSPKPQQISSKYPWMNPGVFVDDTNREQWLSMIMRKNPWLKSTEI
jgi:hypothetical protein